ncbi:MAG: M28 family peptidase [Bacteroidota bacterium]
MKQVLLILSVLLLFSLHIPIAFGQLQEPEFSLEQSEIEAHLRFLSSDELAGRRTGEFGNNLAARYLASYFQSYGLQPIEGANGYFQTFALQRTTPPSAASMKWGKRKLEYKKDFVILDGGPIALKKSASVFVGYGTKESDFEGKEMEGKVMVALVGMPEGGGVSSLATAQKIKQTFAKSKGAIAVIELYNGPIPWGVVLRFMGSSRVDMVQPGMIQESSIPHVYLKDTDPSYAQQYKGKKAPTIGFVSDGIDIRQDMTSQNVAGWIEGSDPDLKNEYVLLSAHYDHVGTGKNGGQKYTAEDSIFNGARDNGIGTVALLAAAKSLGESKPKRSVIFLGLSGEELGLLGSRYYVENPLVPLDKTVFNLNSDNGGYNDTSAVSIMGFHRVGAEKEMEQAAGAFGFRVIADPAPEQNLFDRSDNVSFAKKGIPAPSFGPGMDKFDKEILQYYHQVVDEVSTLNFSYIHKFCQAYAHAARLIGNKSDTPRWIEGDKYEAAFKKLYGID